MQKKVMKNAWGLGRERVPPPPSPDCKHLIFALLVLFSQCPYYLRAWNRLQCGLQPVLGVQKVAIMEAVQREVSRKSQ